MKVEHGLNSMSISFSMNDILHDKNMLAKISLEQLRGIKARRGNQPDETGLGKDIEALEWIIANDKGEEYNLYRRNHQGKVKNSAYVFMQWQKELQQKDTPCTK